MNRLFKLGVIAGLFAVLYGCGGSGSGLINVPNPRVRFANLMPGIASAKAQVGADVISSDIPFGTVSDYAITPNGNKDLTVGDTTFSNLATLADQLYEENTRYTGIAYGSAVRTILRLTQDDSQTGNGTVGIRVVNAAEGAAAMDMYITGTGDPLPGTESFNAVTVGTASDYSLVPMIGTNQYRLRVFADGDTSTALVDQVLTIEERDRVTVIVYADPSQPSGFNALLIHESL
jgi:hypothetical protein